MTRRQLNTLQGIALACLLGTLWWAAVVLAFCL